MSSRDVRDMLGLSAEQATSAQSRPKKKAKTSHKRPEGMARELFALIGERAPPIPIGPQPKKYKAAPGKTALNSRWREIPFSNQARTDGLMLKHWRREALTATSGTAPENENGEKPAELDAQPGTEQPAEADAPTVTESEYSFKKYNVSVAAPKYSDEEYAQHLENPEWSKAETDYLMTVYNDFYGKWPVVWDRFEFTPPGADAPTTRTLEHLKARFYAVSAKVLELRTPVSNMTAAEFADHEKMVKFNPDLESRRKRGREALMLRNTDEVKEERYLVDELRRIYNHQERFANQLKELRERLDHGLTDDKSGGASFATHAEISQLFQRVLANDKNRKLQSRRPTLEGPNAIQSPATAGPSGTPTSASQQKRASLSHQQGPTHRQLTSRSEARFGVSTHDRLTPGVTFRSDKLNKLRQAKSQVQTNKIRDVLNEIDVPEFLQMPTEPVCAAMERLISKVTLLLDARKMREKEENEILIEKQRKELNADKKDGAGEGTTAETAKPAASGEGKSEANADASAQDAEEEGEGEAEEGGDAEGDADADADDGEGDTTIKSEPRDARHSTPATSSRPGTRNGKRSASVLSDASRGSSKKSRKG